MILEKSSKESEMSDAAYAQALLFKLASPHQIGDSKKRQLARAYSRLLKALEEAGRPTEDRARWTWRRVKSLWYLEASSHAIRTQETRDLELATALHDARKAHAEFNAETERLAAIHFHQDEDFYRDQIEARRIVSGGVDRAGARGGRE